MTQAIPKRRWFSYSLRAMFALVAVLAAALAWGVRGAHRQREAVAAIHQAGGTATYDYMTYTEQPLGATRFGRVPKPIIDWLGKDFFADVVYVNLPRPTDELMAHVGHLKSLVVFDGNYHERSQVTDVGVANLAKLKSLNHVTISSDRITDESLRIFGAMPQLQEALELQGKQITDAGVAHLSSLRELTLLRLSNSQVTDDGLRSLAGYQKLWALDLDGTRVTGSGLAQLSGIPTLTHLGLERSAVYDAGLGSVVRLAKLQSLRLSGTKVTSAGVAPLVALKFLDSIDLSNTKVTDEVWQHLARISTLQEILMSGTSVTGQGIEQLNQIGTLRGVWLDNTSVTDDTIDKLNISNFRHLGLIRTKVSDQWVDKHGGPRAQQMFQPNIDH